MSGEQTFTSPANLRITIMRHLDVLNTLTRKITRVPKDVEDPEIDSIILELRKIEDILFGFGYEERMQEQREQKAQQRTVARKQHGSVEREVMQLDERVQGMLAALGQPTTFFHGMYCAMLIRGMLLLLDALPDTAYDDYHFRPDAVVASDDPRVAAIAHLIRSGRVGA